VRAEDLRRFALRDWESVAALKAEYWVAEKRRLGAEGALRIGDRLREQVRVLRPDWPSDQERAEDLRSHEAVARKLRLVGTTSCD
jgi:hypothetical protein